MSPRGRKGKCLLMPRYWCHDICFQVWSVLRQTSWAHLEHLTWFREYYGSSPNPWAFSLLLLRRALGLVKGNLLCWGKSWGCVDKQLRDWGKWMSPLTGCCLVAALYEGHGGPRRKGPFTGQWRAWCMLLKMDPWASDKGAGEDKTHCVLGGCGWRGGEEKSIPSSVATSSGRVRTGGWKLREREGNPVGSHLWSFLCVRHWSMNFHTHHLVGSYKTVKFLNNL